MRRKLLKALIIAFLAAVFIITVASTVLRFALSPTRIEALIKNELYERTGRDAGLAHASASLTRGIVIKGFYMLDEAPSDLESISFERVILGVGRLDPHPLHHRAGAAGAAVQGGLPGRRYRVDRQAGDEVVGDRA